MRSSLGTRELRPFATNVTATVKWYNPAKGFGFVTPSDGSPDAFLHVSVIDAAGIDGLSEGVTITCDLAQGQKGPQVSVIHNVDTSTALTTANSRRSGPGGGGFSRRPSLGPADTVEGTVKFFNMEKGFGFITPDQGGKDVFIHKRALARAGLYDLQPEQRVRLTVSQGMKGPEAESIELI
jgi:CspA family cold shock protein